MCIVLFQEACEHSVLTYIIFANFPFIRHWSHSQLGQRGLGGAPSATGASGAESTRPTFNERTHAAVRGDELRAGQWLLISEQLPFMAPHLRPFRVASVFAAGSMPVVNASAVPVVLSSDALPSLATSSTLSGLAQQSSSSSLAAAFAPLSFASELVLARALAGAVGCVVRVWPHRNVVELDVHLRAESMRVCVRLPLSCVSAVIGGGSSGRGAGKVVG